MQIKKSLANYIVFFILNILDAIFTLIHVSNGATELNPLMKYLLRISNNTFFMTKIILGIVIGIILYYLKDSVNIERILRYTNVLYGVIVTYHILLFT